jgi:Phosphodiester glycosidase
MAGIEKLSVIFIHNTHSRMIRSTLLVLVIFTLTSTVNGQDRWKRVDSLFEDLPPSMHVYHTNVPFAGKPFIAWYVEADLGDKSLHFDTDTTSGRRLTPAQFYAKNGDPKVVVNGTFFSFVTNQNLNLLIKNGKLVAHNVTSIQAKGKDSNSYFKVSRSAIGISKGRKADVAWILTDSAQKKARAWQQQPVSRKDVFPGIAPGDSLWKKAQKWNMQTAIGGGPVLVHHGRERITNDEERMFMGKAREDLHPRTAMGYTRDGKLIILAVEGRRPGVAEGASLTTLAQMFVELGAQEALNLDGGGSSCLLVMGRETIRPSDKEGQRPVPGVFMIK